MGSQNYTAINEFQILGFQHTQSFGIFMICAFILVYLFTMTGNLLIIILIVCNQLLYHPMYYFLCNLSLSEILFTTNIVPNMLYVLLRNGATISVLGCFTQFYLFGSLAVNESFLLTAMSLDRFLAICNPLHYSSIMDSFLCFYLTVVCWVGAFLIMSVTLSLLSRLYFCKDNVIDHFFCDFAPILKVSCSDTSMVEIVVSLLSAVATLFPFVFIIVTYGCIIRTILRIQSTKGKEKAFSTCSSHLGVVSTYYTTMIMVYVVPASGHKVLVNKVLSLLYTVVTPLVNPIIYTLRNQEIKKALKKMWASKY